MASCLHPKAFVTFSFLSVISFSVSLRVTWVKLMFFRCSFHQWDSWDSGSIIMLALLFYLDDVVNCLLVICRHVSSGSFHVYMIAGILLLKGLDSPVPSGINSWL